MAATTTALRTFIEAGPLAHVATIGPSGAPQVTVVWVGWDGDDLVSGHLHENQKVRNVRRDPRVSISLEAPRVPGVLLADHAVLTTTATVEPGGAWDLLDRLAKVYMAPDATFPAPRIDGGFVLRYRIERVGGVGPWVAG
jgi:PPOX class probable F420-dependent enzyme